MWHNKPTLASKIVEICSFFCKMDLQWSIVLLLYKLDLVKRSKWVLVIIVMLPTKGNLHQNCNHFLSCEGPNCHSCKEEEIVCVSSYVLANLLLCCMYDTLFEAHEFVLNLKHPTDRIRSMLCELWIFRWQWNACVLWHMWFCVPCVLLDCKPQPSIFWTPFSLHWNECHVTTSGGAQVVWVCMRMETESLSERKTTQHQRVCTGNWW